MNQVICPLDNQPCELDCPDRYKDEPSGGCMLSTAAELGGEVRYLGGDTVGIIFRPGGAAR